MTLCLLIGGGAAARADDDGPGPWRIHDASGAPPWLSFGFSHRTRFEHLANQFRPGLGDDATAVSMRNLVSVGLSLEPVFADVEIEDSRAFASLDTPLGTSIIDALEILQANAGLVGRNLLRPGDQARFRVGRMTMDLGSRRLLARNRFRNTLNAFTGIDAQWASAAKHVVRVFVTMPIIRKPSDPDAVRDNDIEIDDESTDSLFWGVFYGSPALIGRIELEAYALGLHERDGASHATRNRQLVTPGLRVYRKPAAGELDFEGEAVLQVGRSRASTADDDTDDLHHLAYFGHVAVGFTLPAPWAPRLVAQYDYASGDRDPDDDDDNRFDTLFGARRFDFGPTGIYGPFARSNLNTPGGRVQVRPLKNLDAFVAYRLYWLASDTDAWTTTRLRDPSGDAGSYLGQQIEGRMRWNLFPGNLRLELGAAYLVPGSFVDSFPEAQHDPSTYVYTQVIGTI